MKELIIFKKAYDFAKWLLHHTNKFPKSSRFSMAVKLEICIIEFIRKISIANTRQNKLPLLRQADEELIALKIFLRLSHDMKFISIKSYGYSVNQLEEIGKLLGGWIKSQDNKNK